MPRPLEGLADDFTTKTVIQVKPFYAKVHSIVIPNTKGKAIGIQVFKEGGGGVHFATWAEVFPTDAKLPPKPGTTPRRGAVDATTRFVWGPNQQQVTLAPALQQKESFTLQDLESALPTHSAQRVRRLVRRWLRKHTILLAKGNQ